MSIRSQKLNSSSPANGAVQASEASSRQIQMPVDGNTPPLRRATALIQKGDYQGAAALLSTASRDQQTRNTLGVCLMRAGAIEEALQVYRALALIPGSVQERFDLNDVYRRNFATSLLLKGLPGASLDVLADTREPDHVVAVRIRAAIESWANTLSFWRWLDWKINRVEPRNCNVPIDFEPGEFDFHIVGHLPSDRVHSVLRPTIPSTIPQPPSETDG